MMAAFSLTNLNHTEFAHCLPLPKLPDCTERSNLQSLYALDSVEHDAGHERIMASMADMEAEAGMIAKFIEQADISFLNFNETEGPEFDEARPGSLRAAVESNIPGVFIHKGNTFGHSRVSAAPSTHLTAGIAEPACTSPIIKGHQRSNGGGSHKMRKQLHVIGVPKKARSERKPSFSMNVKTSDSDVSVFSDMLDEYFEITDRIGGNGPEKNILSSRQMAALHDGLLKLRAKKILKQLGPNLLLRIMNLLNGHVIPGLEDDFIEQGAQTQGYLTAMEAAQAMVVIMTADDMPKQVFNEEMIERLIQLTKHHIVENIAPVFDPTHKPEADVEEDTLSEDPSPSGKRKRKSKGTPRKKSFGGRTSRGVTGLLDKVCSVIVSLADLLSVAKLQDHTLLQLTKCMLDTLKLEDVELLQTKAIEVLCRIFRHYPQHRVTVIEDLVSALWKLPVSKRNLRTYHLPDSSKVVRMTSALMVLMIQSAAPFPNNSGAEVSQAADGAGLMRQALEDSNFLWSSLLKKWSTPKQVDAGETRATIDHFVQDLLAMLNVPEYPAASLLLQVFCVLLLSADGLQSRDAIIRGAATDLLGSVAGRLREDAVSCRTSRLWVVDDVPTPESKYEESGNSKRSRCAVCLERRGAEFCITCNSCQRNFHGACGGVTETDKAIAKGGWQCCLCVCTEEMRAWRSTIPSNIKLGQKTVKSEETALENGGGEEGKERARLLHHLLLNKIHEGRRSGDMASEWAMSFYACLWVKEDLDPGASLMEYRQQLGSFEMLKEPNAAYLALTRETTLRISMELGQHRPLAKGFSRLFDALMAGLKDDFPVPRGKASKALGALVKIDGKILDDETVASAVEGRFMDSAISVREFVVDLFGKHILVCPDLVDKYYVRIADRMKDTGVSVRKTAINRMRDIVLKLDNFPSKVDACVKIMGRIVDEEDSVKDLVIKTFHELWFLDREDKGVFPSHPDVRGIPFHVYERAEQLVAVSKTLQGHLAPLVAIIRQSMQQDSNPHFMRGSGQNLVPQGVIRRRCEQLCKCFLEQILQAFETDPTSGEVNAYPYAQALHAFCLVNPSLCVPAADPLRFAQTLLPYLQPSSETQESSNFVQCVVEVIESLLPLLRRPPPAFLKELEDSLYSIVTKHRFLLTLQSGIKCLCALRQTKETVRTVPYLFSWYLDGLKKKKVDTEAGRNAAKRALFVLGLFSRYAFDMIVEGKMEGVTIEEISQIFKEYLKIGDTDLMTRALQGLGYLFVSQPSLMIEEDTQRLITSTLTREMPYKLTVQSLKNILDYLYDVESKLASSADAKKEAGAEAENGHVPVAAGAGDMNNNCGGIVQVYWDRVLDLALDPELEIRQNALKVMEVVLRQGFVHPISFVPTLVALEVDHCEANAKLAHRMMMIMRDKHSQFLENKLGEGLEKSFEFIQLLGTAAMHPSPGKGPSPKKKKGGTGGGSALSETAREGMSHVYRLIRQMRSSRNKFLGSVVRKFEQRADKVDLHFLQYCAEILASLPFTLPDEPLYLINAINRTVQLWGGSLQTAIKTAIAKGGPLGEAVKQAALELEAERAEEGEEAYNFFTSQQEWQAEEAGETGAKEGGRGEEKEESQEKEDEVFAKLQTDCQAGTALAILLSLKRHLKYTYNLSDARCQDFQPTEPLQKGEPLSKRDIGTFSCKILPLDPPDSMLQILKKYHAFKALMKDDTTEDFNGFSVPSKRRSSAAAEEGDSREVEGVRKGGARTKRRKSEPGPARPKWEESDPEEEDEDDEGNPISKRKKGKSVPGKGKSRVRKL